MAAFSSSHTFQGNHIEGQARVHLGDHHGDITNNETHHHYSATTTNPEEEKRRQVQRQAQIVLNSLYQEDPSLDRERLVHIKGDRAAGTCEWVLKDDKFQSLVRGECSTLWISGGPGLGKTVLSVFLTQHLESHFRDSADVKVIYYFCNYLLRGTRSIDVVRALLWQVLKDEPEAASHLFDRYFFSGTPNLSNFAQVWTMLKTVLQQPLKSQRIIFILDGLDECDLDSVADLSAKLAFMPTGEEWRAKLPTIIVSRDIPRLRDLPRIRLDPDHENEVSEDVKAYVAKRIASLSYLDGYNETFQCELQELLLKRAAGTFLWVGFAITELARKSTCYSVLQTTRSFPMGLSGFYNRMLHQVDMEKRSVVARLLQWVALARRSLWLKEVAVIVDSTPEAGLSEDQAVRDVIAECGPMLRVTEEEVHIYGSDGPMEMRPVVVLVHQSARDYLLRADRDDDAIAEIFRIVASDAHLDITRECLAYIRTKVPRTVKQFDQEDTGHDSLAVGPLLSQAPYQDPLLLYARFNWMWHAKHIPSSERLLWRSQEFYRDGFATQRYWYVRQPRRQEDLTNDEIGRKYNLWRDPLSAAIQDGVKSLAETILEDAKSAGPLQILDMINGRFCSYRGDVPIFVAIKAPARRQEMVELLLSQGADVNIRMGNSPTPLHYACLFRSGSATIKLLLDAGAKINALDEDGSTPLDDLHEESPDSDEIEVERVEKLLRSYGAKRSSEFEISEEKPKPNRLLRIQKRVFGRVVFG